MNFRAYAKINIGLRILNKRPDGYHAIETVFHQIDLYDDLVFEPSETLSLSCTSPGVPADETNLCIRAARLMIDRCGTRKGIAIQLIKHIPVGAGLGGGSSDAATVLLVLNRIWNVGLKPQELMTLASELGSDVPFFVHGGTAEGTSRGELLDHFELRMPYWILTVTPPIHVSTAWAYANVKPRGSAVSPSLRSLVANISADPGAFRTNVRNDFEEVVSQTYPEVRNIMDRLKLGGAFFVQLSGSGSSIYGLFPDGTMGQSVKSEFGPEFITSLTAPDFRPVRNFQGPHA